MKLGVNIEEISILIINLFLEPKKIKRYWWKKEGESIFPKIFNNNKVDKRLCENKWRIYILFLEKFTWKLIKAKNARAILNMN